MPLPVEISSKKCCVGVKGWTLKLAVLAALHPAEDHVDRPSKYRAWLSEIEDSGDVAAFEKTNGVLLSVYRWRDGKVVVDVVKEEGIDLLEVDGEWYWIKDRRRFLRGRWHEMQCRWCLEVCRTEREAEGHCRGGVVETVGDASAGASAGEVVGDVAGASAGGGGGVCRTVPLSGVWKSARWGRQVERVAYEQKHGYVVVDEYGVVLREGTDTADLILSDAEIQARWGEVDGKAMQDRREKMFEAWLVDPLWFEGWGEYWWYVVAGERIEPLTDWEMYGWAREKLVASGVGCRVDTDRELPVGDWKWVVNGEGERIVTGRMEKWKLVVEASEGCSVEWEAVKEWVIASGERSGVASEGCSGVGAAVWLVWAMGLV